MPNLKIGVLVSGSGSGSEVRFLANLVSLQSS